MRAWVLVLAGLAALAGAIFVVHHLNDFARVQNAHVGNTPLERDTLSQLVIRNDASRKIAFQLRCDYRVQARGELMSRQVVLAPGASIDVDVNPELAGRELPRMIASKSCEATWRGPLGTACRAWVARWDYNRPVRKGVIMADEDGACRIATCYATGRLVNMPSCLFAVYVSRPWHQRKP